ncbi:MAG TPA: acyltransferase, partial [Terriglobia bacterium]
MKHETNRIPSLDGLRCIAVMMVLFSHLLGTQGFLNPTPGTFLYEFGNLGVKVFFVISGFLITNLLLSELEKTNKIHLGKFYFRRTFRIFPACYFMIVGLILFNAMGLVSLTPRDVIHAVTYTSNYYPGRSWAVGHTWSLGVEEQFYLLWPAVLVFLGRRKGFMAAASVIFICPIIRVFLWHYYKLEGIGFRFETVADAIATGCLLAGAGGWLKAQAAYRKILESKFFVAVPAAVLFFHMFFGHPTIYYLISHTMMNIGIALCLDWCVTYHTGIVGRILNSKPLVGIGVISYSLYLWQQMFFNRHSPSAMTSFPANVALVAAAALMSYFVIEKPSLRLRQRFERNIFSASARRAGASEG